MITHGQGGTTFTGASIPYYRLCVLKSAVGLECKGLKVRRGPVVWRAVKAEFGLRGNREAVYAWLCAEVERIAALQQHETPAAEGQ